jgi:hypothetical protein
VNGDIGNAVDGLVRLDEDCNISNVPDDRDGRLSLLGVAPTTNVRTHKWNIVDDRVSSKVIF